MLAMGSKAQLPLILGENKPLEERNLPREYFTRETY